MAFAAAGAPQLCPASPETADSPWAPGQGRSSVAGHWGYSALPSPGPPFQRTAHPYTAGRWVLPRVVSPKAVFPVWSPQGGLSQRRPAGLLLRVDTSEDRIFAKTTGRSASWQQWRPQRLVTNSTPFHTLCRLSSECMGIHTCVCTHLPARVAHTHNPVCTLPICLCPPQRCPLLRFSLLLFRRSSLG